MRFFLHFIDNLIPKQNEKSHEHRLVYIANWETYAKFKQK